MSEFVGRLLSTNGLDESAFLFGCRQSGKTMLLRRTAGADLYIDLLKKSERMRYTANAELLGAEIASLQCERPVVVVDEIQKVPGLLDEVHRVIESDTPARFILTGSSARKLKRSHANMLGGRAVTLKLFPFCYPEIKESFALSTYLHFGGLPSVWLAPSDAARRRRLASYVETYLNEEIYEEAAIRNLPAFTRFLEFAGHENGNTLNYAAISMQLGVSANTVREYFRILADTLLGFILKPYAKSHRQRVVKHPKFYFVDTGIAFALRRMLSIELTEAPPLFGDAFEHFIIIEIMKAITYLNEEIEMSFFRTSDGAEVDLVLEKHGRTIPIEIKSSTAPGKLSGLRSFLRDHEVSAAYCACRTPRAYSQEGVRFIPWQDLLLRVYDGALFPS